MGDNLTDQDLPQALNKWLDSIKSTYEKMDYADQSLITMAGAQAYAKLLRATTKAKHYSSHDDKVHGHMADSVIIADAQSGKLKKSRANAEIGSKLVGFDKYHAMNAMRINDGTKKLVGDHFITNLQNDRATKEAVLTAEKGKFKEVVQRNQEANKGEGDK